VEDVIGVITVIGRHVVGDHRVRSKLVDKSSGGTRSSGIVDIGAVRVESESVGSS